MEHIETICQCINQTIPNNSTRQWDEEFHVVRILFEKDDSSAVLPQLETLLNCQYDFSTIDNASDIINEFISSIFGLIPGQIVLTTDQNSPPFLFAVWWPWGDNKHISLRIGVFSNNDDFLNNETIKNKLQKWFNISD